MILCYEVKIFLGKSKSKSLFIKRLKVHFQFLNNNLPFFYPLTYFNLLRFISLKMDLNLFKKFYSLIMFCLFLYFYIVTFSNAFCSVCYYNFTFGTFIVKIFLFANYGIYREVRIRRFYLIFPNKKNHYNTIETN